MTRTRDHSYQGLARRTDVALASTHRNLLFTRMGSLSPPIYDLGGSCLWAQGDRLLLCSDGLWDPLCEAELLAALARDPVSLSVPRLVEAALQRAGHTSDNVTALALQWEMPGRKMLPAGISTEDLQNDAFQTTIQPGPRAEFEDELSEAAIERSMAEINETIRRSAERRR